MKLSMNEAKKKMAKIAMMLMENGKSFYFGITYLKFSHEDWSRMEIGDIALVIAHLDNPDIYESPIDQSRTITLK